MWLADSRLIYRSKSEGRRISGSTRGVHEIRHFMLGLMLRK